MLTTLPVIGRLGRPKTRVMLLKKNKINKVDLVNTSPMPVQNKSQQIFKRDGHLSQQWRYHLGSPYQSAWIQVSALLPISASC